jgi:hypothetical protein
MRQNSNEVWRGKIWGSSEAYVANYASKNINGKIKARTGDISISFSFGLNKFIFQ